LASNEAENFHIAGDHDTALPAVLAYSHTIEIPVQGTQDVGTADHGGMNNGVVVGVRQHDAGGGAREYDLRNPLRHKIIEILSDFIAGELRGSANTFIGEDPLEFLKEERRHNQ
jgi:hypothetical protein